MTSQIRVDEITNRSGLGTVTIYDNGFEFTGVTTFTEDVDITGGLTIGGVLTYEDTTNIDSVGVVTARAGVHVTGGNLLVGRTTDYWGSRSLVQEDKDGRTHLLVKNDNNHASASAGITLNAFGNSWAIDCGSHPNNTNALTFGLDASLGSPAEKLRITSAGRIGINETSPDTLLHVKSADNVLATFESTDADALIEFKDNSTTDTILMGALGGDDLLLRCDAGNIIVKTDNNTEKLRITSGGNIGVGENTPLGKVHIKTGDSGASSVGASADELVIEGSGNAGLTILSATTGEGLLNFGDSGDVNVGSIVYNHSTNSMQVKTADVERLSIKANGDFQLAWNDGQFVGQYYDANYYMGFTFASNHRELYIDNKANDTRADIVLRTLNGSGTPAERLRVASDGNVTLGRGGASLYFQNGFNDSTSRIQNGGGSNNSNFKFYTISSGSEAERLRIQSDGNVIPMTTGAYNLGIDGNRWNKVWTNYVRYGTRSATYEKTFTATSDGSGNITFDCGILWLIDDSSFEVFCHMDRTGAHNNFAARYKFYGSKVSGFGTQGTYRTDTATYYIISPVSNPSITHYTPTGFGASHGTRVSHTGVVANAEYRLSMLINWVGQQQVT